MNKKLLMINYIVLIVLLILTIFAFKTSKDNQKDIKEIRERMGINGDTEEGWIDETLDENIDTALIGDWKYDTGNMIELIRIDKKGNVGFYRYYVTEQYTKAAERNEKIKVNIDELDVSEYYKMAYGKKGHLNYNVAVYTEYYNEPIKEGYEGTWKESNATTERISKTSDITIKIGDSRREYTKQ